MYNEVNTSPLKLFFHQKWVRIVLAIDVIVIIIVIGIAIYNSMKTAIITFNVTPTDATIFVGDTIYENGTYKFLPGSYDVAIIHPDLDSKYFHLDLAGDSSTNLITFLFATEDGKPSFDFYELKQNYDSYQVLASIANEEYNQTIDDDTSAEEFIKKTEKNLELYNNVLPLFRDLQGDTVMGNKVSDGVLIARNDSDRCSKKLCIMASVTAIDNYEDFTKKILEENGFKVEDFEIEYQVYK